jgi:hypothetical protein
MRGIVWIAALMVLGSASGAVAQSDTCPTDVEATIAAACPCDASANHGKFVSCVVRQRNDLRRKGCLDAKTQRLIARCAARSTCGKDGAVLCCVYDTSGICSDTVPDGVAAGTCSNDTTKACDTNTDCITATGPTLSRHADTCTAHGGTPVGTGSVCSACPIPPPAP